MVGRFVGAVEGDPVGVAVGVLVGLTDGAALGDFEGEIVEVLLALADGSVGGDVDGIAVPSVYITLVKMAGCIVLLIVKSICYRPDSAPV